MNTQIRRFGLVMLAVFVLLLANLLYYQVIRADALANDNRNARTIIKEYSIERGRMIAGSGDEQVVVAESVATDDALRYLRRYPEGRAYSFVTGFYSFVFGRHLAEASFNDFLIGQAPEQFAQNLEQLLTAEARPGGTLQLTIDPRVQAAAIAGLGERKGAVVALEPSTGAVLALTSFPRYDPNPLSGHDSARIRQAWERLERDPDQPRLNRAASQLYPPGSTFKVITAAAALEDGISPEEPLENADSYTPPLTRAGVIRNFGGSSCKGGKPQITLTESLEVSCNTVFARLGNRLGAGKLVGMAEKFGFNAEMPYQLEAATSQIPADLDPPAEAQSAIGQRDVRASPLQMASIAATIANGGRRMAPRVVDSVKAADNSLVKRFPPKEVDQAISPQVAGQLQDMMVNVVDNGTGSNAQIPGIRVGGKTGTAQRGEGQNPHAWFIGFASSGDRQIAVAVIIEAGGDLGSEATGGQLSAPIARNVIQAYLGGAS
jgi:peptidoglycan glycosyltransferase